MIHFVQGSVTPQFEPVRAAFLKLWQHHEVGASLCVYFRGEKVVDLWGGWQDINRSKTWHADTLVNIYSTTKGVAALALGHLHATGAFAYSDPVNLYWPEFAQNAKGEISIGMLLSHQAGLSGFSQNLLVSDLYQTQKLTNLLAGAEPSWIPGTQSGYHVVTWGFLAGEILRRITGKTLGCYLREHITQPLGADCHLGLLTRDLDRCADLIGPNRASRGNQPFTGDEPSALTTPVSESRKALRQQAQQNPIIRPFKDACSTAWRQAEIPASNGHATAEGLARLYAYALEKRTAEVGGFGLDQACRRAVTDQTDLILGQTIERSQGGFILNPGAGFGPSRSAFGHNGAGGSSAFADPEQEIAFAYVMNQMHPNGSAPRAPRLADCFYECLHD